MVSGLTPARAAASLMVSPGDGTGGFYNPLDPGTVPRSMMLAQGAPDHVYRLRSPVRLVPGPATLRDAARDVARRTPEADGERRGARQARRRCHGLRPARRDASLSYSSDRRSDRGRR